MVIERLHYPEIGSFTDAENYVYSLYRNRHAPETFGGISYKNRKVYIKVDDDGRLISFILFRNKNIDGVKGKGREIVSIKAWDRCFDETYDIETNLSWFIYDSWGKGFYVWYETEDGKPSNIGDLGLFQKLDDHDSTFILKKPKLKKDDDVPLSFLYLDELPSKKKERKLELTDKQFTIEVLRYPDLNVRYPEDYIYDLYESKNHPDSFDWVKIEGCELDSTVDNDGRLLLLWYGVHENIEGIEGNGFRLLGLKAWNGYFDEIEELEFVIHCMVTNGSNHYNYVWFTYDGKTNLYGELKDFKQYKDNVYIKRRG